jgi:hypothetical protein
MVKEMSIVSAILMDKCPNFSQEKAFNVIRAVTTIKLRISNQFIATLILS